MLVTLQILRLQGRLVDPIGTVLGRLHVIN